MLVTYAGYLALTPRELLEASWGVLELSVHTRIATEVPWGLSPGRLADNQTVHRGSLSVGRLMAYRWR